MHNLSKNCASGGALQFRRHLPIACEPPTSRVGYGQRDLISIQPMDLQARCANARVEGFILTFFVE